MNPKVIENYLNPDSKEKRTIHVMVTKHGETMATVFEFSQHNDTLFGKSQIKRFIYQENIKLQYVETNDLNQKVYNLIKLKAY